MSTREFFHSSSSIKVLQPGQSLAVTDQGKPSFMVTKAGKRPRRTLADLEREARLISQRKGKLQIVRGLRDLR